VIASTSSSVEPGHARTPLGPPSRDAILVLTRHVTPSSDEKWAQIKKLVQSEAAEYGLTAWMKSCTDADIPGMIRTAPGRAAGIVIDTENPTCTTEDLHDALTIARIPTVQVRPRNTPCSQNLPNPGACLFSACSVVISGAGVLGYQLAIRYLAQTISDTTL
jgi:3-dehydroquinate dehydratase